MAPHAKSQRSAAADLHITQISGTQRFVTPPTLIRRVGFTLSLVLLSWFLVNCPSFAAGDTKSCQGPERPHFELGLSFEEFETRINSYKNLWWIVSSSDGAGPLLNYRVAIAASIGARIELRFGATSSERPSQLYLVRIYRIGKKGEYWDAQGQVPTGVMRLCVQELERVSGSKPIVLQHTREQFALLGNGAIQGAPESRYGWILDGADVVVQIFPSTMVVRSSVEASELPLPHLYFEIGFRNQSDEALVLEERYQPVK